MSVPCSVVTTRGAGRPTSASAAERARMADTRAAGVVRMEDVDALVSMDAQDRRRDGQVVGVELKSG
jgi:hypothetical protein